MQPYLRMNGCNLPSLPYSAEEGQGGRADRVGSVALESSRKGLLWNILRCQRSAGGCAVGACVYAGKATWSDVAIIRSYMIDVATSRDVCCALHVVHIQL